VRSIFDLVNQTFKPRKGVDLLSLPYARRTAINVQSTIKLGQRREQIQAFEGFRDEKEK
jgi:hypothetical protein